MSEEFEGIPYVEMMIKSLKLLNRVMSEFDDEDLIKQHDEIKQHYIEWKRVGLDSTIKSLTSQLNYELDHIESMKYEGFIIDKKSDRYKDIKKLQKKINSIKGMSDEEILKPFES